MSFTSTQQAVILELLGNNPHIPLNSIAIALGFKSKNASLFRNAKDWIAVERTKLGGVSQGVNPERQVYAPFQAAVISVRKQVCVSPEVSAATNDDGVTTVTTNRNTRIKTLEDLFAVTKPDLDSHFVASHKLNTWETLIEGQPATLHQVQVVLQPKQTKHAVELKASLLADIRTISPLRVVPRRVVDNSVLGMVGIPDLHLGKPASIAETGEDWSLDIAAAMHQAVLEQMLQRGKGFAPTELLLPIGNDLLHFDSSKYQTTKGTQLEASSSHRAAFRAGVQVIRNAIDYCLSIAPVRLVIVPGNHANNSEFMLGEVISNVYYNQKFVTINDSLRQRQYEQFGRTMFGFEHGELKPQSLAQMIALEQPQMWATTAFREWILGHWHRKKEQQFLPLIEHGGVRMRYLMSLSAADTWHDKNGFKGIRGAEILYYDKQDGYVGSVAQQV